MQVRFILMSIYTLFLLTGCVTNNEITQEEIEVQNMAADAVSGILFDRDLETLASYNIRKDGFVVILFNDSVTENQYTQVVRLLRDSPSIKGVRAEQDGSEVCSLSLPR